MLEGRGAVNRRIYMCMLAYKMERLYVVTRTPSGGLPGVLESSVDPLVAIRIALAALNTTAEVEILGSNGKEMTLSAWTYRVRGCSMLEWWVELVGWAEIFGGVEFRGGEERSDVIELHALSFATVYELFPRGEGCGIRTAERPINSPRFYSNPFVREHEYTVMLLEEAPCCGIEANRIYVGGEDALQLGELLRDALPEVAVVVAADSRYVELAECESYAFTRRMLERRGAPPSPGVMAANAAWVRKELRRWGLHPEYLGAVLQRLVEAGRVGPEVPGVWRRRCRSYIRRWCGPVECTAYGPDSEKDASSEDSDCTDDSGGRD